MHLYSQEVFINLLTESGMGALSCPPPLTPTHNTLWASQPGGVH